MHSEIIFIKDIVILFVIAISVILLFNRFKLPSIIGFLITGVITGPHGLGLIQSVNEVEILAEIGIVLLLFTIGIEFSLKSLMKIKKLVFLGGLLQVGLTVAFTAFISFQLSFNMNESIFFGFLVSLSSTAIVFKIIQDRSGLNSAHGQLLLAILIFQDIIIILMILLTPIIAGLSTNITVSLATLALKVTGVLLMIFWGFKWFIPKLLFHVVKIRNSELFLMTIFGLCFGIALLTSSVGLSLAFGAFLAGLIISESEYSNQAFGYILPFKDILSSIFFISIGMLLDINFFFKNIGLILPILLCVILLKSFFAVISGIILKYPIGAVITAGLMLGQIGEFSFILARQGNEIGFLKDDLYQLFLAVSILTMSLTPLVSIGAQYLGKKISGLKLPSVFRRENSELIDPDIAKLKKHLLIIGFGLNGRNVARAAVLSNIPYVIIEMNPQTVRTEKVNGEPIFYGDATREHTLKHAGIVDALVAVVVISDPAATERITETIKRLNPSIHLIVRTRFVAEVETLYKLGADEVIPEEFETSVEIFSRVLSSYLIPRPKIDTLVSEIRAGGYEMFRTLSLQTSSFSSLKLHIPNIELCSIPIQRDSEMIGKSLAELAVREKYSVNIIAIFRNEKFLASPSGENRIEENDIIYLLGRYEDLNRFKEVFSE
ncbi:cation:proton antiporter [candidate division KSB1 bacterium]